MKYCLCGCGETVARKYVPGHDQKLRIRIEKTVGGLENLQRIVEAHVGHSIDSSSLESSLPTSASR